MPYTAPTAAEFKTQFSEYASTPDAQITPLIVLAGRFIDQTWIEGDYKLAMLYFAAHMLSLSKKAQLAFGSGTSGSSEVETFLKSVKFADRQLTYEVASKTQGSVSLSMSSTEALASTPYGQLYLMFLRKNVPTFLVV